MDRPIRAVRRDQQPAGVDVKDRVPRGHRRILEVERRIRRAPDRHDPRAHEDLGAEKTAPLKYEDLDRAVRSLRA